MRFDSVGLFWQDLPADGERRQLARVMPPIPATGWRAPKDMPNLAAAKVISIDVETKDPHLTEHGPGWARNDGHIVGISVGADDDGRWYFPIRHEVCPEENLKPELVLDWAKRELSRKHQPKVGANLIYDIGWLRHEGVNVAGELVDVQFAEALLNENINANDLDNLGLKYCGIGKETQFLYQWCADFYGGKVNGKQRANIFRAPPSLVGPYAISDIHLPLQIIARQYKELVSQGLLQLFQMECALIPLLVDMRFAGVTVDIPKAEQLHSDLSERIKLAKEQLRHLVGFDVNVNANDSLGKAFDKFGIQYERTEKAHKPKITKEYLEGLDHPVANIVKDIRKYAKIRDTFVESYILNSHINGKVYGQFHPLRGGGEGDKGTRSGRFSSSTPNLQNLPSRDDELAPLTRGIFIPDFGHKQWRKYDYSQIEYRFLAHYAVGPGADDIRSIFQKNPYADYHEEVRQLIHRVVGIMLERKPTKNINFGMVYGMGQPTLTSRLHLTKIQGRQLFDAYHKGVPFVKTTMDATMEEAQHTGMITTILGRRSRFDKFEPADWGEHGPALSFEAAIRKYGRVKRAFTHKALNRRLQGSAADLMKMAMLKCYYDGVFDETGIPRLTVHDELDFSDPGGAAAEAAYREMQHIMETAIPLRIPIIADPDIGPDWGHVEKAA